MFKSTLFSLTLNLFQPHNQEIQYPGITPAGEGILAEYFESPSDTATRNKVITIME